MRLACPKGRFLYFDHGSRSAFQGFSVGWAAKEGSQVLPVCAKFEEEMAGLDEEDRQMFMEDGCQVDELFIVNGITCVSYLSEEEDCCGLVFFHPEGLDYLFMLEAFNYSGNVDTLATVLCSLTPTV